MIGDPENDAIELRKIHPTEGIFPGHWYNLIIEPVFLGEIPCRFITTHEQLKTSAAHVEKQL